MSRREAENEFLTGLGMGMFAMLLLLAAFALFVPGANEVREDWTNWQECIQTREGGDASLEWCDETFRNPARSEE